MAPVLVAGVFFIVYNKGVKGEKTMFNNFASPYGYNSMPTATQPYGYPMNPYNNVGNTTPTTPTLQAYTNLIYVSGVEDVKTRAVPAGGTMIFADNDKPLLYKKTVDNKGQYEIETFDILPHKDEPKPTEVPKDYVPRSEFEALQKKISTLEDTIAMFIPTKSETKEVIVDGNKPNN